MKIWSVQALPLRNPAFSFLRVLSMASEILLMILAMILLPIDRSVIPRQLLQSYNVPFLGILMMVPLFQTLGIIDSFQMSLNIGYRMFAVKFVSILKSSAFKLSLRGAFPFLRLL